MRAQNPPLVPSPHPPAFTHPIWLPPCPASELSELIMLIGAWREASNTCPPNPLLNPLAPHAPTAPSATPPPPPARVFGLQCVPKPTPPPHRSQRSHRPHRLDPPASTHPSPGCILQVFDKYLQEKMRAQTPSAPTAPKPWWKAIAHLLPLWLAPLVAGLHPGAQDLCPAGSLSRCSGFSHVHWDRAWIARTGMCAGSSPCLAAAKVPDEALARASVGHCR